MFDRTHVPITKDDIDHIDHIESKLNIILPEMLVRHYLEINGGSPEKSYFYSEESDKETHIQLFSPFKYVNPGMRIKTIEDRYELYKQKASIMTDYLPFANDFGANPICVNLKTGEVCIIYMDLGEITSESIIFLSDNFDNFIAELSENSVDD